MQGRSSSLTSPATLTCCSWVALPRSAADSDCSPSVAHDLRDRGITPKVVTGQLFGVERQQTLQSTRVVFDIHRIPGNFDPHRFIVTSAGGAAIVSEPFVDPWPIEAGVHYLESEVDAMAETISALLADEPRRRRIVDAAQEMLRTEMSLQTVLPRVLGPYMEPLGAAL